MSDVDWEDPCAALTALRPSYYAMLRGEAVSELRHNGKVIVHHRMRPSDLKAEIDRLEIACAAKQGKAAGKRFAIRGA